MIKKGALIYEGKGKKVFETSKSHEVILFFKDDLTAYQGLKKGAFFQKRGNLPKCILSGFFLFKKSGGCCPLD